MTDSKKLSDTDRVHAQSGSAALWIKTVLSTTTPDGEDGLVGEEYDDCDSFLGPLAAHKVCAPSNLAWC